jgi:hypothetical protein
MPTPDKFECIGQRRSAWCISVHESKEFLQRVACQVSPLSRLGEGARASDAPVDKFRDWQESTNSIFCARPLAGLRQQMGGSIDAWFPAHAASSVEALKHIEFGSLVLSRIGTND